MKKCKIIAILLVIVMAFGIFASCGGGENKVTSIAIKEGTVPTSIVAGDTIDLSQIKIEVKDNKGKTTEVSLVNSMLPQEDLGKLSTAGTHTITVTHEGQTCTFTVTIAKKENVVTHTDIPKDVYVDAIATVFAYYEMAEDGKKIEKSDHWRWRYAICEEDLIYMGRSSVVNLVKRLCDKAGITEAEINALVELCRDVLIIVQDYVNLKSDTAVTQEDALKYWYSETTVNAIKQVIGKVASIVPAEKLSVLTDELMNIVLHDDEFMGLSDGNDSYLINGIEYKYEDFEAAAASANVTEEYKKAWNTIMGTKNSIFDQAINKDSCLVIIKMAFAVLNTVKNLDTQKVCGLIEYCVKLVDSDFDMGELLAGESISYRETIKQVNFLGEFILSLYDGVSGIDITDMFGTNLANVLPRLVVTGNRYISLILPYLEGTTQTSIDSGAVVKLVANVMKDITAIDVSDIYLDIQDVSVAKDETAVKSKIGVLAVRVANILNNSYNKLTNEEKESIKSLLDEVGKIARGLTGNKSIEIDTFINIYKECIKYTADTITTDNATKIGKDLMDEVTKIMEYEPSGGVLLMTCAESQLVLYVKQNTTKAELFGTIKENYQCTYYDYATGESEEVELQESMITAYDSEKLGQQRVTIEAKGVSCIVSVYVYGSQTFDNLIPMANSGYSNYVYHSYVGQEIKKFAILSHNQKAKEYATAFVDSQGFPISIEDDADCALIYDTSTVGDKIGFIVFDLGEMGKFAVPFKYVVHAEYGDNRPIMVKYYDQTVLQNEDLVGRIEVTMGSYGGSIYMELIEIKPEMLSGYDKTKVGVQEVTITYKETTCKIKVTVMPKEEATKIASVFVDSKVSVVMGGMLDERKVYVNVWYAHRTYAHPVRLDSLSSFLQENSGATYTWSLNELDTSVFGDKYLTLTIKDGDKPVASTLIWVQVVATVNGLLLEPDAAGTGWEVVGAYSWLGNNLIIPSTYFDKPITSIGNYSMNNNPSSYSHGIHGITIPDSVKNIGKGAFSACSGLMGVTFGENSQLTHIGEDAFYNCDLTELTIPKSTVYIGARAFYNSNNLTEVTIPANVTYIGEGAFLWCYRINSVTFETPSGWKAGETSLNLTNTSDNATYLTETYGNVEWNRD